MHLPLFCVLLFFSFGFVLCEKATILYIDDREEIDCNGFEFPSSMIYHAQYQKNVDIVFVTKSSSCVNSSNQIPAVLAGILTIVDKLKILTSRSKWFVENSRFFLGNDRHLNVDKYFIVNDVMAHYGTNSVLLIDSDQFIFGQLGVIIPILKAHYSLAALPRTSNQGTIFAGILWISTKKDISEFTDYLLDVLIGKIIEDLNKQGNPLPPISKNFTFNISEALPPQSFRHNLFSLFVPWVRRFACCKLGGLFPDEGGQGIKTGFINEMTFLAHYHHLFPPRVGLLPTVPLHRDMPRKKNFFDLKYYACGGVRTGVWNSDWIWDSGTWGATLSPEYVNNHSPKDLRNIDIIEHAISQGSCKAHWSCKAVDELHSVHFRNCSHSSLQMPPITTTVGPNMVCFKVPVVTCSKVNNSHHENLLFNIAIKNDNSFKLERCLC